MNPETDEEVDTTDWCLLFKFEDIGQVLIERTMNNKKNHVIKVKVIDKENGCPISKVFKAPNGLSSDEERKARDDLFYAIGPQWAYWSATEALESLKTIAAPRN